MKSRSRSCYFPVSTIAIATLKIVVATNPDYPQAAATLRKAQDLAQS